MMVSEVVLGHVVWMPLLDVFYHSTDVHIKQSPYLLEATVPNKDLPTTRKKIKFDAGTVTSYFMELNYEEVRDWRFTESYCRWCNNTTVKLIHNLEDCHLLKLIRFPPLWVISRKKSMREKFEHILCFLCISRQSSYHDIRLINC
jgi:hypothetical protein